MTRTTLLVAMLLAALGLVSCSSTATTTTSSGSAASAPGTLCESLNGVLSDGPDPDTDPVGYAESQILPLQDIHSSDSEVTAIVSRLVGADQELVQANGNDRVASSTIKKSFAALNKACPGVAP